MDYSEKLIVKGLQEGDTEAFRYIYDTHYQVLCHIAEHYIHDEFQAESIVGDVIFHLWECRKSLVIDSSLRSFLTRSVRNKCLDYLKSSFQRHEIAQTDIINTLSNSVESNHPLGILLEKELEGQIEAAIERLPRECQRVFTMSRLTHKKNAEIAAELGISINTVKYHIKHALRLPSIRSINAAKAFSRSNFANSIVLGADSQSSSIWRKNKACSSVSATHTCSS